MAPDRDFQLDHGASAVLGPYDRDDSSTGSSLSYERPRIVLTFEDSGFCRQLDPAVYL
jgi:hypothetical protein